MSAVYNPEVERLVEQETGAEKVVIFDHTIRVESNEKRNEKKVRKIINLAHNADHRWCYFPNMTADEVMIFKSYDSMDDGRARFTPHTAFIDPSTPAGAPPRESIETRALAFFPPDA